MGFEPNPVHYQRFKNLERLKNDRGWKTCFYPYVVSDVDRNVEFWIGENSINQDWGVTLCNVPGEAQNKTVTVQQIKVENFIRTHLSNKLNKLMKFDVEGAEYEILTDFLNNELCRTRIETIMIEWHQFILETREWRKMYETHKDLPDLINA